MAGYFTNRIVESKSTHEKELIWYSINSQVLHSWDSTEKQYIDTVPIPWFRSLDEYRMNVLIGKNNFVWEDKK